MELSEFYTAIENFSKEIENEKEFSKEEYLMIAKLWNTICYYTSLQSSPIGRRFFELVRDKELSKIVETFHMSVSRGFSFYSKEIDFMLGGILEERFRFVISDINT